MVKTALVCGAGGFIGGHLVKKLKREGYWVRGVDIKEHEYAPSAADEFRVLDLREPQNCQAALARNGAPSTRSINWPPIWGAWASYTQPSAKLCTTACSSISI